MTHRGNVALLFLLVIAVIFSPVVAIKRHRVTRASVTHPVATLGDVTGCVENRCINRTNLTRRPLFAAGDFWTSAHGCFCDDQCSTFGDCCRDAPESAEPEAAATCSFMSDYNSHLYMVTECPVSWPDDSTRQACISEDTRLSRDPLLALPVTSIRSGRTYRNAACARCHSDTEGAVLWGVVLECPGVWLRGAGKARDSLTKTLRRREDGEWGVTVVEDGVESFKSCSIQLKVPQKLEELVRGCLPSVSDCASDWRDHSTAAKCASYTARVRDLHRTNPRAHEFKHVYRNPDCARCNGVPLTSLRCGGLASTLKLGQRGFGKTFSFSILFDTRDHSGSEDVGVVEVCSGTRVWDSFFHKCRDVFCSSDHLLQGDVCVPKEKTSPSTNTTGSPTKDTTGSSHFRSCPKFFLSPDEFEARADGSVYVQLYDQLYVPGEFELRDDELVVCTRSVDLSKFGETLGIVSLVFVVVSILCLAAHLALFCLVPEQRNLPGKNLAALCVCLLIAYVCFVSAPFQQTGTAGCRALGITMYAAFTASFLWMNVTTFDVFISLRRAVTELRVTRGARVRPFLLYALYSGTGTAVLVGTALACESAAQPAYRPGFGQRLCWFSRRRALLALFGAPLLVIMAANAALFVASALIVRRVERTAARAACAPSKTNLRLCGRLAVVAGLSWPLGVIAGWTDFPPLWHLCGALNALQGVFIFCSFTVRAARRGGRCRPARPTPWRTTDGRGETDTDLRGSEAPPPTSETEL